MNSFIAWIGGKRLLRKAIIERFPEEGFDRYIEVFGGAGWVLFGKEVGKELEVFNDADSNLINLYRCIKYHCEELQKELNWLAISREQFFDNKSQLNARGLTDIQRAARYFHIIKVSFGADRKTFGTNKKRLLGEKRWTQKDLADATGIRPSTINEWYHELVPRLNVDHIDKICEALDCTITDLLEYIPNERKTTGKYLILEEHGNRKQKKEKD